jgi:hypothetical protein
MNLTDISCSQLRPHPALIQELTGLVDDITSVKRLILQSTYLCGGCYSTSIGLGLLFFLCYPRADVLLQWNVAHNI